MLGQRVHHSEHIEGKHKLRKLLSTFYYMAPGTETQVIKGEHFYQPSHLTGPESSLLRQIWVIIW